VNLAELDIVLDVGKRPPWQHRQRRNDVMKNETNASDRC
jgi:hypothetical protein